MSKQISFEHEGEKYISPSENMNRLMGVTLMHLAKIHPDRPRQFVQTDDEFCKDPVRLAQYRDQVLGYYNEHNYYDVKVTKALIFINYLDSLVALSRKNGGFDNIFNTDGTPNPISAAIFYQEISRQSRPMMTPSQITPQEFSQFLVNFTQRHIPQANLQDGELAWLMPQNQK